MMVQMVAKSAHVMIGGMSLPLRLSNQYHALTNPGGCMKAMSMRLEVNALIVTLLMTVTNCNGSAFEAGHVNTLYA